MSIKKIVLGVHLSYLRQFCAAVMEKRRRTHLNSSSIMPMSL